MYKKRYNFGGFLKKALPVAGMAANFIPGVGPVAGMAINAGAQAISSSIPGKQPKTKTPTNYASSTYGYRMGGIIRRWPPNTVRTDTVRTDTTKVPTRSTGGKVPTRRTGDRPVRTMRTSEKQDLNKRRDIALKERLRRMKEGDYSMVGKPLRADTVDIKRTGGTVKNLKGGAKEFVGPSHEQGGIDIGNNEEVEGGETMDFIVTKGGKVKKGNQPYVFSDKLHVPNSNVSFAKYHKQLVNRGAGDEAIQKLAHLQEKTAGRGKSNPNQMRYGGATKKYNDGGITGMPELDGASSYSAVTGGKTPPSNTILGMPKDQALAYGASMVPDLVNVATGMFGKDKTKPAVQVDKSSVNSYPTHYNINPQLQANRKSFRAITADPNATTNQKLAAQSQKMQADSQAYATKQNKETQMKARKAHLEAGLDRTQSQHDAQYRQDKMASEANLGISGNFARKGLTGLSSKISQIAQDKYMAGMDSEQLKSMVNLIAKDNPELAKRILGEIEGLDVAA